MWSRTRTTILASILISSLAAAQRPNGGGGPSDAGGRPGAGGNYGGPGDTVPTGGAGGPRPAIGPAQPGPNLGAPGLGPSVPAVGPSAGLLRPDEGPTTESAGSRPIVANPNSWQLWWFYNRWSYLEFGGSAPARFARTGTGGFYLGSGERMQTSPLLKASQNQIRDAVAPTLLTVLDQGGSNELLIHSLHSLAKLRDLPVDPEAYDFTDAARELLRSGNQDVAEKAVLALGIRGEERFFPWLQDILTESPRAHALIGDTSVGYQLRAFAAYALGLLAERTERPELRLRIYQTLMDALPTERDEVQAACVFSLGLTPLPVLVPDTDGKVTAPPEDLEALADSRSTVADSTHGRIEQVLALLSLFEDASLSYVVRSQIPESLARLLVDAPRSLRDRVSLTLLSAASAHTREPKEVQHAAVIALGSLGNCGDAPLDQEIRKELARVAYKSSADRQTRYFAMIALGEMSARPGRGGDRWAGIETTRKLFLHNLKRSRGQTLCWTALGLGLLERSAPQRGSAPDPQVSKALRLALQNNRSGEVVGALAIALGLVGDAESEHPLVERMVETGETHVRGYCALGLGMIHAYGAVPRVRTILEESTQDPFALERSAISLSLLRDQDTGHRLFEMLEEASNPEVQASIASALGWIQDPRPILGLCTRLRDKTVDDNSRAWAAVALGRICDADDLPWVGRASIRTQYDVNLPTLIEPEFRGGLLDLQ